MAKSLIYQIKKFGFGKNIFKTDKADTASSSRVIVSQQKSMPGRFYFETYLPEYGALYDKLPISAFVSDPEKPELDLGLQDLQFYCMDYGVTTIYKQFIGSMDFEIFTRSHHVVKVDIYFKLPH